MVKKLLRNFYLTDVSLDDDVLSIPIKNKRSKKKKSKIKEFIESMDELEEDSSEENTPKVDFIIEEDKNKEKHIKLNFEFYDEKNDNLIKIEMEISKSMYLEIANELIK